MRGRWSDTGDFVAPTPHPGAQLRSSSPGIGQQALPQALCFSQ
jgi:hypothetical protein